LAAFSSYVLALAPKFHMKSARVNVDEIDTRIQSSKGLAMSLDLPMLTKPISVEVPTHDVVSNRYPAQQVVQENLKDMMNWLTIIS